MLLPFRGTCFHCGHDHGESGISPFYSDLLKRHADEIALLKAALSEAVVNAKEPTKPEEKS